MKKKTNLKQIIGIIALFLLTALVLYFTLKDDFNNIIDILKDANYLFVIIAFLLLMFYWTCKALVLYNFTKKFNKEYKFYSAFRIQAITQFFNAVTPFSTGGQPFQIYSLKKHGLNISDATNVTIEEFVVYQISLVLLGIIAIISNKLFHIFPYNGLLSKFVVIGFTINTLVIITLFIIAFGKKTNKFIVNFIIKALAKLKIIKNKEKTIENWNIYINNFHSGAKILVSNKKDFILNILYSILGLISYYVIPLFILYSIGDYTSFNWFEAIVSSAYVMLIGSFVPLPGGTGGIEYGFINFFGVFILSAAKLKAIMLLWRFTTFYMGIILGAIFLNLKERK